MIVCTYCLLVWILIYVSHIKFDVSPISGIPWSFYSSGKQFKKMSSPILLLTKNAGLIFCRSHCRARGWGDGSMGKTLATMRTEFRYPESTEMLNGHSHSHVIPPAGRHRWEALASVEKTDPWIRYRVIKEDSWHLSHAFSHIHMYIYTCVPTHKHTHSKPKHTSTCKKCSKEQLAQHSSPT